MSQKHAPLLEAGRGSFGVWHVYQLRYTAPPPKGTLTERVDPDSIGVNPDLIGVDPDLIGIEYIQRYMCCMAGMLSPKDIITSFPFWVFPEICREYFSVDLGEYYIEGYIYTKK